MARAVAIRRAGTPAPDPVSHITLRHDERRLRRKLLSLPGGEDVLVDFAEPVTLSDGDRLLLEDGRSVEVRAADEDLFAIAGRDAAHLLALAWHLGNRHLPCEVSGGRGGALQLRVARDHVVRGLLTALGASLTEVRAPFSPVLGAHSHSHGPVLPAA